VSEVIEGQRFQGMTIVPSDISFEFDRIVIALFKKIGILIDGRVEGITI
jgi:hypothetical protein